MFGVLVWLKHVHSDHRPVPWHALRSAQRVFVFHPQNSRGSLVASNAGLWSRHPVPPTSASPRKGSEGWIREFDSMLVLRRIASLKGLHHLRIGKDGGLIKGTVNSHQTYVYLAPSRNGQR